MKPYKLDYEESRALYEAIQQYKPTEINQCYLNTFMVANFLRANGKKYKNYKIAYGFMKVIDDEKGGYEDWQYHSYVRHAFIVNDKNKVIDTSFIHLVKLEVEKTPPMYLVMKKYSIEEYFAIVMNLVQANCEGGVDLPLRNGQIKSEKLFRESAAKNGYILVD